MWPPAVALPLARLSLATHEHIFFVTSVVRYVYMSLDVTARDVSVQYMYMYMLYMYMYMYMYM